MNGTRRAILAGLLVALIVAAGYALAGVPNVELVTLLVFVSGFLLGPGLGAAVGGTAWALHSTLNPLGAAAPPVLGAQVLCGAVIGLAGALVGRPLLSLRSRPAAAVAFGVTGFVLTAVYQVVVNAAAFVTFADRDAQRAFWGFIAAGLAFTATHLVWNTAVFSVAARPVLSALDRYRGELGS